MSTTWTRRGISASLLTALAALCVPGAASAQGANSDPHLVSSNATLGGPFEWLLFAQPQKPVVLIPSLESGPTPLALVDPTSQLVMGIGLDLFTKGFVYSGLADSNGEFKKGITLPQSPNLAGLPLRAQAVTLFNSTGGIFDALSNVNSKTLKVSGQNVYTQGSVLEPRRNHTATALPDGRVLLIGGEQYTQATTGTPSSSKPLATMELFDPESETFVPVTGGILKDPRSGHTSTFVEWLDPSSNTPREGVVVAGGFDKKDSKVLSTVELIEFVDDMTVVTSVIGEMSAPRHMHTATATPDGRVLLIGGLPLPFDADNPNVGLALQSWTAAHSSSVFIDPAQHAIKDGPKLPEGIFGHSASLTRVVDNVPGSQAPIGQIYVTGGVTRNLIVSQDAYTIDLLTSQILFQSPLLSPVAFHSQITLLDGSVLIAGGADGDPTQGLWTPTQATMLAISDSETSPYLASDGPVLAEAKAHLSLVASESPDQLGFKATPYFYVFGGLQDMPVGVASDGPPSNLIQKIPTNAVGGLEGDTKWEPVGSSLKGDTPFAAVTFYNSPTPNFGNPFDASSGFLLYGAAPGPALDGKAELLAP